MGKSVAVVYWSGTGNTEEMANVFAEAVEAAGGSPAVVQCSEFSADGLGDYDAVAFGCPAMGDEELEADEFQPVWDECKEALGDKPVVLFGSYSWAEGQWMENWKEDATGVNVVDAVIAFEAPDDEAQEKLAAAAKALVEA